MAVGRAKHLIVLAVVVITAGAIYFLLSTKPAPPTKPQQETTWTVDAEMLQEIDIAPEINLLGRVISTQKSTLTSRVNSTVLATPVQAGSIVRRGQLLLELDATEINATLSQRQAEVSELNALIAEEKARQGADRQALSIETRLVDLAEKALARQQRLKQSQVTSEERLDNAQIALQQQRLALTNRRLTVANHDNRLAQLQARLAQAEARLEVARQDSAQQQLVSPFDGRVASLSVAVGDRVRVGEPMLELIADASLEVRVQIPDSRVSAIQEMLANRQRVEASAELFGRDTQLALDRLAAEVNQASGGVDAFFKPLDDNRLIAGKAIEVRVELTPVANTYSLPISAIYGDNRIYLIDEDNRLKATAIDRVGRYRADDGVERILFTLPEPADATQAIVTQLPKAVTGLKVKIRGDA